MVEWNWYENNSNTDRVLTHYRVGGGHDTVHLIRRRATEQSRRRVGVWLGKHREFISCRTQAICIYLLVCQIYAVSDTDEWRDEFHV